jgi:urocanate hydratase
MLVGMRPNAPSVEFRSPRGATLTCANWQIEAAYRMVQNNLDPENAEDPARLIVYGGSGKAARSHEALEGILATLMAADGYLDGRPRRAKRRR